MRQIRLAMVDAASALSMGFVLTARRLARLLLRAAPRPAPRLVVTLLRGGGAKRQEASERAANERHARRDAVQPKRGLAVKLLLVHDREQPVVQRLRRAALRAAAGVDARV